MSNHPIGRYNFFSFLSLPEQWFLLELSLRLVMLGAIFLLKDHSNGFDRKLLLWSCFFEFLNVSKASSQSFNSFQAIFHFSVLLFKFAKKFFDSPKIWFYISITRLYNNKWYGTPEGLIAFSSVSIRLLNSFKGLVDQHVFTIKRMSLLAGRLLRSDKIK